MNQELAAASASVPASERAKQYLELKKQENVDTIRKRLGQEDMVYSAIRAGKKRETIASNLLGGTPGEAATVPGLVETGDGRILSGGLKVGIADKSIMNSNFDEEWRCLGCSHPTNRPCFKIWGSADAVNASPQAVILGDQAVPAAMQVVARSSVLIFSR
jgi:hypothetical protein